MASSLLRNKARQQAQKVDEQYGSDAYGGTASLRTASSPRQTGATYTVNGGGNGLPRTKASDFLTRKATAQAQKIDAEFGSDAYGGSSWTTLDKEKGINTYLDSVSALSGRLSSDFDSRDGVYQSADSFSSYRDDVDNEISVMLGRSNTYRDYFSENRDLYGDETVDAILKALDDSDSYLTGAREGLQSEYDYWAQFANEDIYNDFLKGEEYKALGAAADELGQYGQGNIDLYARPQYQQADGTYSTVRSMSINEDGKEILIPTIAYDASGNPVQLTDEQAIQRYHETGEYLGKFDTREEADAYADKLHEAQEYLLYSGQGAALENPALNDVEKGVTIFGRNFGGEKPQNIVTYSRDNWETIAMGEMNNSQMTGRSLYHYMTDDEVNIYNYLLARDGEETAQEYLDYLEETLNYRHGTGVAERVQAIENPFGNFAAHGLMSLSGGLDQFATGVRQAGNAVFGDGEKLPTTSMAFTNNALLEDLDGLAEYAYSAGNTVGNMLPSIVIGTMSGGAGLAAMGVSSGGNAYGQAIEEGYSRGQALAYGTAVGASEALLQKAIGGISALSGKGSLSTKLLGKVSQFDNALARVTLSGAVSIGSEITEEEMQLWLEPVFRTAIFGEEFEGPSGQEMLETAIITALATGMLEAGPTVMNEVNTQLTGKEFNEMGLSAEDVYAFVEEGLASDPSTDSYKLAVELKAKLDNGGTLSNYELGKLYQQNALAIQSEEDGAALLEQAAAEVANGGTVTNRMASTILGNVNAVNALTRETGTTLTKDMSKSKRRAAVKNAVASLASRRGAAQTAEQTVDTPAATERTTPIMARDTKAVQDYAKTLGSVGSAAMVQFYDPALSAESYIQAAMPVYNAGRTGAALETVQGRESLNPAQTQALYEAGQADAKQAVAQTASARYTNLNDNLEGATESDGETIHLRNSGQWAGSAYPGGQVSPVAQSAGGAQVRQAAVRSADPGTARLSYGEKVSTASLGIGGGSTNASIRVVTGGDTAATAAARKAAKERGLRLVLFTGDNLRIRQADGSWASVRGYISGDRVFVRADHPVYTADQIMRHEAGHDMIKKGEVDIDEVRERIVETFGEEKYDALAKLYVDAYAGIGMTAEEIWEEVICDSLGDMNIFAEQMDAAVPAAWELLRETKKATEATRRAPARAPPTDVSDTNVGKMSRDYWRPQLTKAEWSLLNHKMDSAGMELDEATYWVYASEKGNRVFCIYGIGDGTDNTPLYASGGTTAEADAAKFNEYLEGRKNGTYTSAEVFDRWAESMRSARRNGGGYLHDFANGRADVGDVRASGRAQRRTGEGASGRGKSNRGIEEVKPKFSMETPVEQTETLVALHNMHEDKLRRTLELGAWPSPSIAIVQAATGHSDYGAYSAVFPRSTIDPEADYRNRVYGSDAWTPTGTNAPLEYEVNSEAKWRIEDMIDELSGQYAGGAFRRRGIIGSLGLEDTTRDNLDTIARKLASKPAVQAAYLAQRGDTLEPTLREKKFDTLGNDALRRFTDSMGVQELAAAVAELEVTNELDGTTFETVRDFLLDEWVTSNEWRLKQKPELRDKRIENQRGRIDRFRAEQFVRNAWDYYEDGGMTKVEIDTEATAAAMMEQIAPDGSWSDVEAVVRDWIRGELDGLLGREGIYNGAEIFDRLGNRKSFDKTHWPVTVENIVRAMNNADARGANMWGYGAAGLAATATPEYGSIEEIHADEGRLHKVPEDEYKQILADLDAELMDVSADIMATTEAHSSNRFEEREIIGYIISQAAAGKRTAASIKTAFAREGYTITTEQAKNVKKLLDNIAKVPTGYFEAKPQRVVEFDEAVAVLAPSDAPADLIADMEGRGINVLTYEAGNNDRRLELLNSLEGVKFSRELDSVGSELSEEQAAYFADSKVRDLNGALKVMYRGGTSDFTVFDRAKSNYANMYGRGFYFTDSKTHAQQYGNARAFYLNITNPVPTDERTITRAQMRKFIKAVAENEDDFGFENYGYGATVDSVLRSVYSGKSDFAMLYDVSQTAIGDMVAAVELFNEVNGTDFDGLILDTETVTFRSEQAKNIDNRTPTTDPDIRYSRELESLSDLREQNEALREKMDYWKGQTKRTTAESRTVRKGDVEKLAKRLIKGYDSTLEAKDIAADLQALGDFLVRGGDGKNELTWADVKDRAVSIARDIVQSAEVLVEDGEAELYREIKSRLRKQRIAFNDQSDIADYGDFRKRNMGKFILAKDGLPIDVLWMELNDTYGESYFPSDIIHPADQLMHLADLLDGMEPIYENPFSYYMAEATEYLANDIIDSLISEDIRQTPPTFADRQAAKLDAQKAKDRQRLDRLRQQKNERIAEIRKQGQERTKEALRKVRADRDAKIKELKAHFRTKDAKARESRKATALRRKIQKHVKALSGELLRPSDKHHVPEALRGPVARLLEAINLESNYELEYGRDAKYHRVKAGESLYAEATKRTQAFAELKKAYAEIGGELVIDPDLMGDVGSPGLLDEVAALADKPLADMNSTELETIWQTIRAVEASIRSANKMFAAARFATVTEAAEALRRDNEGKKAKTELNYVGGLQKLTGLDMLTPEAFLHRLGDSGDAIFRMMRGAQDEHIRIMKAVADFTHEALGKVNVNALEKELHTVKLGGEDVKLSTAQLMELYALMRREQAQAHIMAGGILPDVVSTRGLKKLSRPEPVRGITIEEIADAIGLLSPEQVAIAERLQDYASKELSDYGNRASMEVYNYKKFTEEHYWPIRSNRQETKSTTEKDTQVTSVANRGFTKATKPNANTSVMLGSIFDTFATHASEMATYAAWLGTTEDINRIRNYTFRDGEGNRTGTVKGIVDRVHGTQGSNYLQKLLSDIANGVKGTHGETEYMGGFVGNYKAASVGANLRVIIQQPTAILRAMDMLAPQYLVAGMKPSGGWKKALKYAPIAQWKDWGYFDIHTGRQMKDVLFDSDSVLQKIKSASMWGAGKMDSAAWGMLWNAVETETKAKHKELKPGTKEYYDHVAARFTEIVDRTQVVDGILQRSQIMRSASSLNKMATAFMGEPTKQYNMLLTSAYDARHATSKERRTAAKKRLARTAFALSVSGITNAAAQAIMDAVRDDDKEKDYWEKWLSAFTGITGEEETFGETLSNVVLEGNLGSTFNPLGYIPYVKDALSLIQGYDVSRMDMDSISNTITAAQNMYKALSGEGKYSIAGASANLFAEAARMLGIPVANLKREAKSFAMLAAVESDNYLMQYRMEKASLNLNYSGNTKTFYDILYNAYENDREAYEIIYADMVKSGFDTEKIKGAMETRMKAAQGVTEVDELESRYLSPEQETTYSRTLGRIEGTDLWSAASADQRSELEKLAYDLVTGNSDGEKMQEKIDGGSSVGIDTTDYLLYKLALEIADQPTESGKYGTYTQEEAEAAIGALTGLTDDERAYLWQSTNSGWKEDKNPWR